MNRIVITEVMSAAFDVEQHNRQFFFLLIMSVTSFVMNVWRHSFVGPTLFLFVCGKSGENVQRHEKVCCAFLDDRRLLGEDELCD